MHGSPIDDFLNRLHALEAELETEFDRLLKEKRRLFQYTLEQGRVRFEQGMRTLHRHQREGLWAYLRTARLSWTARACRARPNVLPFVVLDIMVTLYQHVCFRVYDIPRVARAEYFVIDRHHLAYLNAIEKFNCIYCGYANGLIEYVREISARTEAYWCPIRHTRRSPDPHQLVEQFVDYGDADAYKKITTIEKIKSEEE